LVQKKKKVSRKEDCERESVVPIGRYLGLMDEAEVEVEILVLCIHVSMYMEALLLVCTCYLGCLVLLQEGYQD